MCSNIMSHYESENTECEVVLYFILVFMANLKTPEAQHHFGLNIIELVKLSYFIPTFFLFLPILTIFSMNH